MKKLDDTLRTHIRFFLSNPGAFASGGVWTGSTLLKTDEVVFPEFGGQEAEFGVLVAFSLAATGDVLGLVAPYHTKRLFVYAGQRLSYDRSESGREQRREQRDTYLQARDLFIEEAEGYTIYRCRPRAAVYQVSRSSMNFMATAKIEQIKRGRELGERRARATAGKRLEKATRKARENNPLYSDYDPVAGF